MSVIPDPIQDGLAAGWQVTDCAQLQADQTLEADVVIVGSGAGGGVTAEILALSGLKVLIVEEGALKSSKDFKMREATAYPELYQEAATRKTKDKGITILQGRTVGGSTTVNWTSSFRTPDITLRYWNKRFGLSDYTPEALAPWFEMMEQRLNIIDWPTPPNENNDLLRRGAAKLNIPTGLIRRNVNGCWNLGYCGMGCPTNAKQSMLITTIPSALQHGAHLLTRARAEKLAIHNGQVSTLECVALTADGLSLTGRKLILRAKHFVLSGGAINTPALLMRSLAPDPHGLLGKRTFLHPSMASVATYTQRVEGYSGAPQTTYSDHFLHTDRIDGPIGYKLEVPPLHPLLFSAILPGFGAQHAALMQQFPHLHAMVALLRDGFHDDAVGGSVALVNGAPVLDYPVSDFVWDGARRALLTMAEIQFAAGATSVMPVHERAQPYTSWAQAKTAIESLPYKLLQAKLASAHVMGGCGMSDDVRLGVTSSKGRYHGLSNLSVHDGSLFPTSIGANPQLSIYGIVARLASGLAQELTGKPAARPVRA
ncbi:GMC family oxidoreductase [Pseudoduganella sp. FT55W]|uniref:GMC family oxidoreductase n=1 Tax=Duganella rivi TaxID=2666083 RepID=A0A7X4GT54_9BURK|nr:GMC family oxidoreductase [Duganella rivi]MYM68177.1 GMC family oxidoreductase [Duganella rivi]